MSLPPHRADPQDVRDARTRTPGTARRRHNVLLIAELCNPEWVSVPLVGWSHAEAIRRVAEAHLVTQVRNRDALLRAGLTEGRDFTAIDSEAVARRAWKIGSLLTGGTSGKGKGWTTRMAVSALAYPHFERLLWRTFGGRLAAGEFDVVHHLTPLSPTIAPRTAARCRRVGVPFVWGPLNGGVPWPKGFDRERRREREWLSYVRGAYRLLPGYRSARRSASAILVGSGDTCRQMPTRCRDRCVYLPENAIDPTRFDDAEDPVRVSAVNARPPKAVFVGRLVPYKGADMLLKAAAPLLRDKRLTLSVVGDGPQLPLLRRIVESERLSDAVTLTGWVEHRRVRDHLADAHLMPFPSIREFGGGVALEAMALGVVPIVPAYGGLGELVTPQSGWLVPIGTREQIVARFRETLSEALSDPAGIDARGVAGRQRVLEAFTWDAKARQTLSVYDWVTGHGPKPEWPIPTVS